MSEHCATCSCVDVWPGLPEGFDGTEIRSRKVFGPPMTTRPVRLGGAEPMMIVFESRDFVIYNIWSSKGEDLGEKIVTKEEFEAQFERRTQ